MTDDLLSPAQAGRLVGRSEQSITGWAKKGKLPFMPTPLGRLYRAEDVKRVAAEHAARSRHQAGDAKRRGGAS